MYVCVSVYVKIVKCSGVVSRLSTDNIGRRWTFSIENGDASVRLSVAGRGQAYPQ